MKTILRYCSNFLGLILYFQIIIIRKKYVSKNTSFKFLHSNRLERFGGFRWDYRRTSIKPQKLLGLDLGVVLISKSSRKSQAFPQYFTKAS